METQDPNLQFSVLCLDLVEGEKKPPTLQYLFYELPLPYLPYKIDRFHVVNCWTNGLGRYQQAVRILDSTKTKIVVETGQQAFNLEDPFTPQLMINVFVDIEFTEEGHLWVQTFLNEALILQYPLTVRLVRQGLRIQLPDIESRITQFSTSFA